jgi:hypothetical protein
MSVRPTAVVRTSANSLDSNASALRGSSPDEAPFLGGHRYAQSEYAASIQEEPLPIGLKLNITDSFIRRIETTLDGPSSLHTHSHASKLRPMPIDVGSYPTSFDPNFFGTVMMDHAMNDGYDALDFVLNSNAFTFDDDTADTSSFMDSL